MLSGTGLSRSDRDDNESNLFWVSREVEVLNKVMEKFGIPYLIHSHTMHLPEDLFRLLYIVVDMPQQSTWYQILQVSQQIPRSSRPTLSSQAPHG